MLVICQNVINHINSMATLKYMMIIIAVVLSFLTGCLCYVCEHQSFKWNDRDFAPLCKKCYSLSLREAII